MDHKPEIDKRVSELRNAMGRALWEIQGVEQILAKYYAVAFKLTGAPTLEEIQNEFEKSFAPTAGRLVGMVKEAAAGKDVAADRLEEFVTERNWLVHKLRRLEYLRLKDHAEFEAVIGRVEQLGALSEELTYLFHTKLRDHFIALGTPAEVIDSEQKKELQRIYGG